MSNHYVSNNLLYNIRTSFGGTHLANEKQMRNQKSNGRVILASCLKTTHHGVGVILHLPGKRFKVPALDQRTNNSG
jgi:hypothetical protein